MNHLVKTTSKGQITLPAKWRKRFDTNQFLIKEKAGKLEIVPIDMTDLDNAEEWTSVFNADRDNDGKPLDGAAFLEMLRSVK